MAVNAVGIRSVELESIGGRRSVTERATLPGRRRSNIDDRRGSSLTFSIEGQSTFFLSDEFLQGGEVLRARFMGDVVRGDIDSGEGVSDLLHVVSHPGESAGEVLDVWAEEDSDRVAVLARVEDALIAVSESDIELSDGAISESGEFEGAGTSAVTE